MADLKDILSNSNKDIDNQKLMDYLAGRLKDDAARHDIEASMDDDGFMADAMEGLQLVDNKQHLDLAVFEMNQQLKKQLKLKEKKKEKRKIQNFQTIIIAAILILLLCILGFVIIKMASSN